MVHGIAGGVLASRFRGNDGRATGVGCEIENLDSSAALGMTVGAGMTGGCGNDPGLPPMSFDRLRMSEMLRLLVAEDDEDDSGDDEACADEDTDGYSLYLSEKDGGKDECDEGVDGEDGGDEDDGGE